MATISIAKSVKDSNLLLEMLVNPLKIKVSSNLLILFCFRNSPPKGEFFTSGESRFYVFHSTPLSPIREPDAELAPKLSNIDGDLDLDDCDLQQSKNLEATNQDSRKQSHYGFACVRVVSQNHQLWVF